MENKRRLDLFDGCLIILIVGFALPIVAFLVDLVFGVCLP